MRSIPICKMAGLLAVCFLSHAEPVRTIIPTKAAGTVPGNALATAPSPAVTAALSGQIKLSLDGKALRGSEAESAVIYFRSATVPVLQPPKMPYVMRTERKQFFPAVLPIILGSQVQFPNFDPILHNAFSTSNGNAFDLGLYGKSEGESTALKSVGVVRVYCNVHHSMTANILVLDTPYFTQPNANGVFTIRNLPMGKGELFVWHERAQLWRLPINITADMRQDVQLSLVKLRVPPHLNKFGKPYRRSNDSGY
jgi:plastocyanin